MKQQQSGLLIFRPGADPRNSGISAKSREIPKKTRNTCLLYTSDAADERSSVDLGGRRIIKKQPISLGFFLANFAKIDQFCVDITSVGKRFF